MGVKQGRQTKVRSESGRQCAEVMKKGRDS